MEMERGLPQNICRVVTNPPCIFCGSPLRGYQLFLVIHQSSFTDYPSIAIYLRSSTAGFDSFFGTSIFSVPFSNFALISS